MLPVQKVRNKLLKAIGDAIQNINLEKFSEFKNSFMVLRIAYTAVKNVLNFPNFVNVIFRTNLKI
jgi:hypothetical protein